MGDLIDLAERRARLVTPAAGARPVFVFELGCPFSYLGAERVERLLGDAEWVPSAPVALRDGSRRARAGRQRAAAERLAASLRLPLVWPDSVSAELGGAMRAAAHAAQAGAGPQFALAASRLAFCGGYDLEDPETLAEAAAVAGIGVDACLAAARDSTFERAPRAVARALVVVGVRRLPAISVGARWFDGSRGLDEAAALIRARAGSMAAGGSTRRPR
jgi:2-hydroxychromene-2-carboxylate isomerase